MPTILQEELTLAMDLKCARCGDGVVHTCNNPTRAAAKALLAWVPENVHSRVAAGIEEAGLKEGWLEPGEKWRDAPFFGSQAWSYAMFGKEEARTFHSLLSNLLRAAGVDERGVQEELAREEEKRKAEEKERLARVAARKAAKAAGQNDPQT